jgi:kinesin family protein C2/C3
MTKGSGLFSVQVDKRRLFMFVHISPDVESFGETVSTLKFAERVSSVELGAARSNKESGEVQNLRDEVQLIQITAL